MKVTATLNSFCRVRVPEPMRASFLADASFSRCLFDNVMKASGLDTTPFLLTNTALVFLLRGKLISSSHSFRGINTVRVLPPFPYTVA